MHLITGTPKGGADHLPALSNKILRSDWPHYLAGKLRLPRSLFTYLPSFCINTSTKEHGTSINQDFYNLLRCSRN